MDNEANRIVSRIANPTCFWSSSSQIPYSHTEKKSVTRGFIIPARGPWLELEPSASDLLFEICYDLHETGLAEG